MSVRRDMRRLLVDTGRRCRPQARIGAPFFCLSMFQLGTPYLLFLACVTLQRLTTPDVAVRLCR